MAKEIRHTVKDNIFRDLFSDVQYVFQLYQSLHPEDKETTQEDIKTETLESIIYGGEHNDLGFSVKDKMIILVEAQTTWSVNILIRFLGYLANSYHTYYTDKRISLYSTKKVQMPKPELYMVYTGDRGNLPDTLSLRKEYFAGQECCIEVEAKIIYVDYSHTIIDQYIQFCRVLTEQRKIHGDTEKAIQETLRICRDKDLLQAYLKGRESEVIHMMMALFDQEVQDRLWENEIMTETAQKIAETAERNLAQGIGIGREEGELSMLASLVRNNLLAKDIAAAQLGITVEEFDKRYKAYCVTDC